MSKVFHVVFCCIRARVAVLLPNRIYVHAQVSYLMTHISESGLLPHA